MTKYIEILNLQLLHQYYKDGQCKDLNIHPDQATADWLKGISGLFRNRGEASWSIVLPDSVNLTEESQANPDFSLQFYVQSSSPDFSSFTEVPLQQLGYTIFSDQESDYSDSSSIELKGTFETQTEPHQEVAMVKISLKKIVEVQSGFPLKYSAQFQARSVQWKYFFIQKSEPACDQLILKGTGSEYFESQGDEVVPGGTAAKVFSSGINKIAIQEMSPIDMSLSCKKAGGEELLIQHLPNASAQGLQQSADNSTFYTAMYVYL